MRPVSSSDIVISSEDRIASSSQEAPRRRKDKSKDQSSRRTQDHRSDADGTGGLTGAMSGDRMPLSGADGREDRRARPAGATAGRPWSRWLPRRRSAPRILPDRGATPEPVLRAEPSPQDEPAPRVRRSRPGQEDPAPARNRRKRILPRWTLSLALTPLQKLAAGGVVLTALLVSGAVVWHSGVIQHSTRQMVEQAMGSSARAGFRIQDITVTGRGRTGMEDIAQALQASHGGPILSLNLEEVKDRLEAIPSIQHVAVERRLPSGLHISIVERIPVAVWQNNGQHILVDKSGHMIPGPITGYEDLPLVVGDGAAAKAAELLAMLKTEPDMARRVKASVRVANRRWNLKLDDAYHGLEVRLPEDQAEAAWHRLARLEREQALTQRRLSMIDLRAPDRLILKADRPPGTDDVIKPKDSGA